MRILQLLHHLYIVQLDIEVLIHRLECASDGDVVLELDCHFVVHQSLEEAVGGISPMCYGIGESGGEIVDCAISHLPEEQHRWRPVLRVGQVFWSFV